LRFSSVEGPPLCEPVTTSAFPPGFGQDTPRGRTLTERKRHAWRRDAPPEVHFTLADGDAVRAGGRRCGRCGFSAGPSSPSPLTAGSVPRQCAKRASKSTFSGRSEITRRPEPKYGEARGLVEARRQRPRLQAVHAGLAESGLDGAAGEVGSRSAGRQRERRRRHGQGEGCFGTWPRLLIRAGGCEEQNQHDSLHRQEDDAPRPFIPRSVGPLRYAAREGLERLWSSSPKVGIARPPGSNATSFDTGRFTCTIGSPLSSGQKFRGPRAATTPVSCEAVASSDSPSAIAADLEEQ